MPAARLDRSRLFVPDLAVGNLKSRPRQDDSPGHGEVGPQPSRRGVNKIRAMIDMFESRDETSTQPTNVSHKTMTRTTTTTATAPSLDDRQEIPNEEGPAALTQSEEPALDFRDSPFLETIDSLTHGKTLPEQNTLLHGLVLDLLQEVDAVHLELQQVYTQLAQREQLIQDLRDERKLMKEDHQCKLLGMAQALSELDQQQAVMDLRKQLESDVLVSASEVNGIVIQQLTNKVEELELQNAELLERLECGKDTGMLQVKGLWNRRQPNSDEE